MEDKINESKSLLLKDKKLLLKQIKEIKEQLDHLSEEDHHGASSIAGYAAMKTHESLAEEKDESLVEAASLGLKHNLQKFQSSHPILMNTIDLLFRTLSRLGV